LLGEPSPPPYAHAAGSSDQQPSSPRLHDPSDYGLALDREFQLDDADAPQYGQLIMLDVHEIDENPFQPRREFGESEIASLAESLKEHDMLQPVLVRRVADRWQLISGERRLRAAIRAGWSKVPARVREADDRLVAELAIVENLQRKDLNPIEKALSFQRYLHQHQCTQDDLGRRLKIDRSTIANLLRLLELPEAVQEAVRNGAISAGHARALLPLGEPHEQIDFANRIRREQLSVRDTERLVQEQIQADDREPLVMGKRSGRPGRPPRSQQLVALEQDLRIALGTKVELRQASRGRGRIVIHFSSHEEFERIRSHLCGDASTQREANAG
jgi:ParB family chromosome partitioning protein